MSIDYHVPVLLRSSVDQLIVDPDGVYVDVTFGGGGHSREILSCLSDQGRLFGFDQDVDAESNLIVDDRFTFVRSNFEYLSNFVDYYGLDGVDGILADLGVSSFHFDEASRGFSYRFDAELDMRMNVSAQQSARDVLMNYGSGELQRIFSEYGEIRNSRSLAQEIVRQRSVSAIATVGDLDQIIAKMYRGDRQRYTSQLYQALRIEVNDELGVLRRMLGQGRDILRSGGSFVVISYHSLEDKIVKRFFKDGGFDGPEEDSFGRVIDRFKVLTKRPAEPTEDEIKENSRAASAKMRVAHKI